MLDHCAFHDIINIAMNIWEEGRKAGKKRGRKDEVGEGREKVEGGKYSDYKNPLKLKSNP